jgi:hypothetical protein
VGWWFDRSADRKSKNPEATKQLGVLLASGMIVGEGLVGVIVAALVAFSDKLGFANKDFPLTLVGDVYANGITPMIIGGGAFALIMAVLYGWLGRLSAKTQG